MGLGRLSACHTYVEKSKMYEVLAEGSTDSLEREIMAIKGAAGANSHQKEPLESTLGEVNEKTYIRKFGQEKIIHYNHQMQWIMIYMIVLQAKDLDHRVRRGNLHASCEALMTCSSADVKKIASESCGQVNIAAADPVKESPPDMPSVLHETQEGAVSNTGVELALLLSTQLLT